MAAFQTDIAAFQTIEVPAVESGPTIIASSDVERRADVEFNSEATLLLIQAVKKRYSELQQQKTRAGVYREIHEELSKWGYAFSTERIRRKWNNLLGCYKRFKRESQGKTITWEFFEPLDEFLPQDLGDIEVVRGEVRAPAAMSVSVPPPVVSREMEHGTHRQEFMKDYMRQLKDRDGSDEAYRQRKERRARIKTKLMRKISADLESIAQTQSDIVARQEQIMRAIKNSNLI